MPHDNDLNEGIFSANATGSTGGDTGRDEIILNADELDIQTVLAAMILLLYPNRLISL